MGTRIAMTAGNQYMLRQSNVVASTSASFAMYCRIASYADWGNPVSLNLDTNTFLTTEFAAAGRLYVNGQDLGQGISYFENNIWTDTYTGGFWLGLVLNGGGYQAYYQRDGGPFVVSVAATPGGGFAFAPSVIGIGGDNVSAASRNGTIDYSTFRGWNVPITELEMRREFMSGRLPRRWSNLTFANPFISSDLPSRDYSGPSRNVNGTLVGGDFTIVGAPTSINFDVGAPLSQASRWE